MRHDFHFFYTGPQLPRHEVPENPPGKPFEAAARWSDTVDSQKNGGMNIFWTKGLPFQKLGFV